jgi:hypothetical protein
MFPSDMVQPQTSCRVDGKVFGYRETLAGGMMIATQETYLNRDAWDDCLACEEFDHCYRLCLAKLSFDHAVGR